MVKNKSTCWNEFDYVGYIAFTHTRKPRQIHVNSWDEGLDCAEGCGGNLTKLVHKESIIALRSREEYNYFMALGSTKGISHVIIPSDVDTKPSYTEDQKQSVISDMLLHFKELHDKRNQELIDSGYGNDIIPFDEISIQELKDYALSDTIWAKI